MYNVSVLVYVRACLCAYVHMCAYHVATIYIPTDYIDYCQVPTSPESDRS